MEDFYLWDKVIGETERNACAVLDLLGISGLDQFPKISGEILLFPPAELSLYPGDKMVQSV